MKGILNSEMNRRGRNTLEVESQSHVQNPPLLASNFLFV